MCNDEFKSNVNGSFKTRLQNPLILGPNAEILLVEIGFDTSIKIQESDPLVLEVFDFLAIADKKVTPQQYGQWTKCTLSRSNFSSPDDLCTYLNMQCMDMCKRLRKEQAYIFKYKKEQDRIWVEFRATDFVTILVSGGLLPLLGCVDKDQKQDYLCIGRNKRELFFYKDGKKYEFGPKCRQRFQSKATKANFFLERPSLATFNEFAVYLDVILPTYVSNTSANILRFVPFPDSDKDKKYVVQSFNPPIYIPLKSSYISEILVELRTLSGSIPSFSNPVKLLLHIKDGA